MVTMHKIEEEANISCLNRMEDAEEEEDTEMIQIKWRYQDITISYMRK